METALSLFSFHPAMLLGIFFFSRALSALEQEWLVESVILREMENTRDDAMEEIYHAVL
jgi:hypothetical protein